MTFSNHKASAKPANQILDKNFTNSVARTWLWFSKRKLKLWRLKCWSRNQISDNTQSDNINYMDKQAIHWASNMVAAWLSGCTLVSINKSTWGLVSTGTGDHFQQAYHLSISTSYPGQFSLLSSAGQEMSIGHTAVMLCGLE